MKENKISVIIVDDEKEALDRLEILFNKIGEIEIISKEDDAENAIVKILSHKPDIVFLDIEMPGKTGFEIVEEINKCIFDTTIIFVTAFDHYAIKAIKQSAFDYILKPVDIDDLKTTIERYKTEKGIKKITKNRDIYKLLVSNPFTKREIEILTLLSQGKSSKEISEQLFISKYTVDTHRKRMLEKFECKNTTELIVFAIENSYI